MSENFRGDFFTHTVYIADLCVNQRTVCGAIKNYQTFGINVRKFQGGDFFYSHCIYSRPVREPADRMLG